MSEERTRQTSACPQCKKSFIKIVTGERWSNGAVVWYTESNRKMVGKKCHACLRKNCVKYFYKANRAVCYKQYEKTQFGFLMRTYRNMLSRVRGILKKKAHLYKGLKIMPKEKFYEWALNDPKFLALHAEYAKDNYKNLGMAPSINRIDTRVGYVPGNIEWITHSENSRLGSKTR